MLKPQPRRAWLARGIGNANPTFDPGPESPVARAPSHLDEGLTFDTDCGGYPPSGVGSPVDGHGGSGAPDA